MNEFALKKCIEIRTILNNYIAHNPEFLNSLVPLTKYSSASPEILRMIKATEKSGTGPMSSVAGMVAEYIGKSIANEYKINEIVVENGGDIYIDIENDLEVAIYAANSPFSNKIAIVIPAQETPIGLCTSSGTVGHSLSFGKADAAMIACKDTSTADAFATRFGNEVKTEEDVDKALQLSEQFPDILSILLIIGEKLGVKGNFSIKPLLY